MEIVKVDHSREEVKRELFSLLAPKESQNLFILGNLASDFPDSHIYVASSGGRWVGVAAYYGMPKSLIPYSESPDVAVALTRHMVPLHPLIEYVNGMAAFAGPACRELEAMGYRPANAPQQVFMEMEGEPPRQESEELARPAGESDVEGFVRLMRHMRGVVPEDAPVTDEDKARAAASIHCRQVLEVDGRLVATAGTNGIGIEAFQIIGVVTHPSARRRGYASAVCASLMRRMAAQGGKRCALFTNVTNIGAQLCYEKLGFLTTGDYLVAQYATPA